MYDFLLFLFVPFRFRRLNRVSLSLSVVLLPFSSSLPSPLALLFCSPLRRYCATADTRPSLLYLISGGRGARTYVYVESHAKEYMCVNSCMWIHIHVYLNAIKNFHTHTIVNSAWFHTDVGRRTARHLRPRTVQCLSRSLPTNFVVGLTRKILNHWAGICRRLLQLNVGVLPVVKVGSNVWSTICCFELLQLLNDWGPAQLQSIVIHLKFQKSITQFRTIGIQFFGSKGLPILRYVSLREKRKFLWLNFSSYYV